MAHGDDDSRGKRKVHAEACKQRGENRNDFPEQQGDNAPSDGQDADRVDHGRFHRSLQLDVLFDVGRKPLEDGIENTARLARLDHVHVQRIKNLGRAAHGGRERSATFHLGARAGQHFLKDLVFLLASKNLKTLDERQTSVNHDGELARENSQLLGVDAPAKCGDVELLPLLGHFCGRDLLTLQDVRQFRFVRRGHHTANARAAPARSLIFVIRHERPPKVPRSLCPLVQSILNVWWSRAFSHRCPKLLPHPD